MIIDRVFTPGLAQVAYLIADEASGDVAIIDPRRDVDEYLQWANERGFRFTAILETHIHADFVSGSLELAARTGAQIYVSWLSGQTFDHVPLGDGQSVAIGSGSLRAFWTPGHTPEHVSFLLFDPSQGVDPIALFSGDSLFVGDVGRPDLLGSAETQDLATKLYYTVTDRLRRLKDDLIVYPGHTAGSSCGKKLGDAPSTTIGQERLFNYAFQARSRDAFVRMVLDGMPPAPTYYPVMKLVNQHGAVPLTQLPEPAPLDPGQFANLATGGAMVIDARSAERFAAGHIPGSIAARLGSNFVAWMGWLAPYSQDVLLVLESADQLEEALIDLRRIGLDRVAGYLEGGVDAWTAAGNELQALRTMDVGDLADRLAAGNPEQDPVVLDVRTADEWKVGHIAGAMHHFAGEIVNGAQPPIAPDREVAVICGSGFRSNLVASLLEQRGFSQIVNIEVGMDGWHDAGLPVVTS